MSDPKDVESWLESHRASAHPAEVVRAERLLRHQLYSIPFGFLSFPKPELNWVVSSDCSDIAYCDCLQQIELEVASLRQRLKSQNELSFQLEALASGDSETKPLVASKGDDFSCVVCTERVI
ncbi:MAG: hypothetical protein AB8C84_08615 [Oligoflexales bacterium]